MDERSAALGSLTSAAILAAASALLHPAAAGAQEVPVDALVVLPSCPGGFGGLRLRRLLILELSDAGVSTLEVRSAADELDARGAITVRLEADCEDDGTILLVVVGGSDEPNVRQQLDLSEVDRAARLRAIAVAAAEQVRLQRLLAEQAPTRAPAPQTDPPSPTSVRRPPPTVRSGVDVEVPPEARESARPPTDPGVPVTGALYVAFEARGFPELATWPIGARVGAWLRILDAIRVGFDLGPGFTATEHPAGRVETWLVTIGLTAGVRWAVTDEVGISPLFRVGLGYASFAGFASAALTTRAEGLAVTLLGTLSLDIAIGSRVGVLVELDVGGSAVAHVALAGDEEVAGTRGVAIGLRSGFLFHL